ncbi:MAG: cbb3-type cytochrome c oxidase subunit 3 [Sphingomonas sp.]|uniref:cbb3-type cytochrome c oxidase subunit 3 n=1 Tax=Sphingomonas sp. TaxID=28214 RepID=UPI000DB1E7CF|nr:CcoQ/FixQ family Cbb3-type cytochrome c oxidase assembly chaperone [Zymomonas sp.]MBA4773390.1 cbb3-type cytochrome c oxidase subunit 3 [Sphingomonas sp.]PZP10898.1 MAG: CcoQ/FixQ family Cbb3-type cytochrome c oxidase assembly chaperone [Sphingomonas hengshuiensis]
MSYDALRHFADSWGLVAMVGMFLVFVGWTFLPRARAEHERAAIMILEDEEQANG